MYTKAVNFRLLKTILSKFVNNFYEFVLLNKLNVLAGDSACNPLFRWYSPIFIYLNCFKFANFPYFNNIKRRMVQISHKSNNNSSHFVDFMKKLILWIQYDLEYNIEKMIIILDNCDIYKSKQTLDFFKIEKL